MLLLNGDGAAKDVERAVALLEEAAGQDNATAVNQLGRMYLDGIGVVEVSTGVPFFDHMLAQLGKHGGLDLTVRAKGDTEIDSHHTVEDTSITLGQALREALENLSYRERRVLELRYGLGGEHPRTLDEVGRTFNVTRERIRQIENQSLKKLQSLAEAQKLRDVA